MLPAHTGTAVRAAEQPLLFEAVGSLLAGPGGHSVGIPASSQAE